MGTDSSEVFRSLWKRRLKIFVHKFVVVLVFQGQKVNICNNAAQSHNTLLNLVSEFTEEEKKLFQE
jgi:hypothetical protein